MAYDKKTGREFDPSDPDQVAWNNSANYGGDPRGTGGIQYPGKGWQDRHPDHRSSGGGRDHGNFQRQMECADRHQAEVNAALAPLEEAGLVTRIQDSVIINVPAPDDDHDHHSEGASGQDRKSYGEICSADEGTTTIISNYDNRLKPIIALYRVAFKAETDADAIEMLLADIVCKVEDMELDLQDLLDFAHRKRDERRDCAPSPEN